MDELFRINVARRPDATLATTLPLERASGFQKDLLGAVAKSPGEWNPVTAIALRFVRTNIARLAALTTDSDPVAVALSAIQVKFDAAPLANLQADLRNEAAAWAAPQQQLQDLNTRLPDLILALMLLRADGAEAVDALLRAKKVPLDEADVINSWNPSLEALADWFRLSTLLLQALQGTLPTSAQIAQAMGQTLGLPTKLLASFRRPVQTVGVADLLLIKQHVIGYEPGEVTRIENVLMGEHRAHRMTRTRATEHETIFETETQEETTEELSSSDRTSVRNEVNKVLKEDLKVEAGTSVHVGGGSYSVDVTAGVNYAKSSETTSKMLSEVARDMTQKAARRVAERTRHAEKIRVTESFEDVDSTEYEGKALKAHASGVYQWIEKVYLAQVFSYGKRTLLDLMVPDPARTLLKAAELPSKQIPDPVPPPAMSITISGTKRDLAPSDLTDDPTRPGFYQRYVTQFKVPGVVPPPPERKTIVKPLSVAGEDDQDNSFSESLRLEDGYAAFTYSLTANWFADDDNYASSYLDVVVGQAQALLTWQKSQGINGDDRHREGSIKGVFLDTAPINATHPKHLPIEEGELAFSLRTAEVEDFTANVEVLCKRTEKHFAKWQLETYEKIAGVWNKLQADYLAAVANAAFERKTQGPLGADEQSNRMTERAELKRGSIAALGGVPVHGEISVDAWPATPPASTSKSFQTFDPNASSRSIGNRVRFFEQAFEWDKIGYVFYDYFWGAFDTWQDRITLRHNDALFQRFLTAGYARVVVPVRPGFEDAVGFFLMTGKPWFGRSLPKVGDPTYLPLIEEMKTASGAPGDEVPVGEPWTYRLPTTLVKLRKDDALPSWVRVPEQPLQSQAGWAFKHV